MKKNVLTALGCLCLLTFSKTESNGQITLLKDYENKTSATIGTSKGITFREAGFSGLYPIPGTNGKEFWVCSDRGVNVDCGSANPSTCRPTYDKMYSFPSYTPKIHRIRIQGDSVQILRTITIKRPNGTGVTGIINPTGLGSTLAEVASNDTVLNCANFNLKVSAKDTFGIDCEGIIVDKAGFFWLCEEGGPTVWKLDQNGKVTKRYTPYFNLGGAQSVDVAIDTVFKYRKNNRGFEGIAITPNGKIYAMIQSPLLYPTQSVGENTRVHRLLEIDPTNNSYHMFAYLNDGIIGASGANQIRLRDWKLGDLAAINDSTFLVIEAAARGTTDIKKVYTININGATVVNSGLYGGSTLEALVDSLGLAGQNIKAVKKTLFMDMLANSWPATLDKAEGLAILNDSTVLFCNDNDYAQTCPNADGIPLPTTNNSHVIAYGLKGVNKLSNYSVLGSNASQGITGINSSQAPYLVPITPNVSFTSILTAGDMVGSYVTPGLPDGAGAFDNGNGTFTLVVNHEFGNTSGATHAHGSTGAFNTKWIINKSDLSVVSGEDLMKKTYLYNTTTSSYTAYNSAFPSTSAAFARFCSGDLPAISAYYNSKTGKGTQARFMMNGEENGSEGRAMAHIITGSEAGNSYELPYLGKASWENMLACPYESDSTIVVGTDDATPGQVYVYVGAKQTTGNEIERAGLHGGTLYGIKVTGLVTETSASVPAANTAFTLASLGKVQNLSGATIQTNSNNVGITQFLRPEDAAWDPANPNDFYFVTTNAFNSPSRMWRVRFTDITKPSLGGTVTAVLDGTEGQQMMDNIGIDNYGHILIVEDVGGNAHIGKIWQYDIPTDVLTQVGAHDTTRFLNGSSNFLTQDEEASGIFDAQEILGPGMWITVDQAHYGIANPIVEGGQILAMFNPDSYNSNPEASLSGNGNTVIDGDITPSATDNTDFGSTNKGVAKSKTFSFKNAGPGKLVVTSLNFTGASAAEFTMVSPIVFPKTINANDSMVFNVSFLPTAAGIRSATLNINSNDFDERLYNVSIQGASVTPKINVQGNSITIIDGDVTAGNANNTDFGTVNINTVASKSFDIQNTGTGSLVLTGITFTGTNANEFTIVGAPSFPVTLAPAASQMIAVQFKPTAVGVRNSTINIANDDANNITYDFALEGNCIDPSGVGTTSALISAIKLYPNPTEDEATIAVTVKKDEKFMVNVVDIQGRLVIAPFGQNLKAGEQQIKLNTSKLNNGIYFVQLASSDATTKIKMVVAH